MIYIIRTLALTLVEVLCCRIFFDTFLKRRTLEHHMDKVVLLGLWGMMFGAACITGMIWRVLVVVLGTFICTRILYNGSFIHVFFISIAEYTLNLMADSIVVFLLQFILQVDVKRSLPENTLIMIMCKLLFLLCVLACSRYFHHIGNLSYIPDKDWCWLMVFPILTLALIAGMLISQGMMALMLSAFGLLLANFLFFYLVQDIIKREMNIREQQLGKIQARNQMQLYQSMEANYEEQQKKIHDVRNQMECVRGLLEDKQDSKALEYINHLYGTWEKEGAFINTNHAIVNSILRQKLIYAEQKRVQLVLEVQDLSAVRMEDEDLVIILANLIDNGIEACERLKQKQRVLKLRICLVKNELQISTQNAIEGQVQKERGIIVTSKREKRKHGIGLKNIHRIVEKYNGEDFIQYGTDYFTHTIVIEQ